MGLNCAPLTLLRRQGLPARAEGLAQFFDLRLAQWRARYRPNGDELGRFFQFFQRGHGRSGVAVLLVDRSHSAATVGDEPLLIHLRTGAPVAVGLPSAASIAAAAAAGENPDEGAAAGGGAVLAV